MVCHHDTGPLPSLPEFAFQPAPRLRVQSPRIRWPKGAVRRRDPNPMEVRDARSRQGLRQHDIPVEFEIGPKRGSEKDDPAEFEAVVFQHMNVRARGQLSEFLSEAGNLFSIKLVVPQHVDHRLVREGLRDPPETVRPGMRIAGEDHHVRVGGGWLERGELQVEVVENVQSHAGTSAL